MLRKCNFHLILSLLVFFLAVSSAHGQAAPRIFFSDLQSGPKTGGQNGKGVFVTIWGTGFGTAQGSSTVTVGGGVVDNCPVWGATWLWYQKVTCQLGANATTGNIVVTVGGVASNALPFTVRTTGNIYFVATGGSDSAAGSFTAPWASVSKCVHTMAAGDTCYVRNGVVASNQDNYSACIAVSSTGNATGPIALVGYPGEKATVGTTSSSGCQYAMRTPSISSGPFAYWVVSQITLAGGGNQVLDLTNTNHWWVVGNDMSCPNTPGGQSACWETSATANYIYAYGNHLHSFPSNDKQYHGFYFSDNVNHVWVGWNSIHDGGCRGIQFHSTGNPNLYDLHVNDNLIYNIRCDAINMATIDPSKGPVEVYNNIVYHAGLGPDYTTQGPSSYTCIASPGITNAGSAGTGTAYFYNNTLYDCSSRSTSGGSTTQGAISVISGSPSVAVVNNIIETTSGDSGGYLSPDSSGSLVSGSNNLCFGSGACPSSFSSSSLSADPLLVSLSAGDFHLQSTSPVIGAGTSSKTTATDHDGLIRPSPPSIGAYEFTSGVAVQRPNPPTGLSAVVN
jgi:hypothetical protein